MKKVIGYILLVFVILCALIIIAAASYRSDGIAGLIASGIIFSLLGIFVLSIYLID